MTDLKVFPGFLNSEEIDIFLGFMNGETLCNEVHQVGELVTRTVNFSNIRNAVNEILVPKLEIIFKEFEVENLMGSIIQTTENFCIRSDDLGGDLDACSIIIPLEYTPSETAPVHIFFDQKCVKDQAGGHLIGTGLTYYHERTPWVKVKEQFYIKKYGRSNYIVPLPESYEGIVHPVSTGERIDTPHMDWLYRVPGITKWLDILSIDEMIEDVPGQGITFPSNRYYYSAKYPNIKSKTHMIIRPEVNIKNA
jgi:hypothetical protein